jgi:hypothetical protein
MPPTRYGPGDVIFFKDGAHANGMSKAASKNSPSAADAAGSARPCIARVSQDQADPAAGRQTPTASLIGSARATPDETAIEAIGEAVQQAAA